MIIDKAKAVLTEKFIKELHLILKNGTSDSRQEWFAVGTYKKMPNEVGGMETALPEDVAAEMQALLAAYSAQKQKHWKIFWIFTCGLKGYIRFRTATAASAG